MNILLIFFALPLATIILSIVLQKLIKNPILVSAIFFSIYLIVAFALFDATFLIAVIIYTILSYITAIIVRTVTTIVNNIAEDDDNINVGNNECGCNQNEPSTRTIQYSCRRYR